MKRLFNIFLLAAILAVSVTTASIPTSTVHAAPLLTSNSWNALGSGLNNISYAIAINGSNIYAGGQFTDAGGDANADRIAMWNGSVWTALGSGIDNGQVNALAFNGSVLYVGGTFVNAGGNPNADYIAQWDGSSWSALGDGLNSAVNAIGVSGLDIYIAGNFTNAGVDINADYIAKLDGGTWAALGATPLTGPVNTIVVAGASVYAGGDFVDVGGNTNIDRIALWDGTSWSSLGSGLGATVLTIALNGTDIYAGGLFTDAGGNTNADKIAKWDGTSWSALGSGMSSFVNSIVVSGSDIYAGGNFVNAGGDANADYIAKWDGIAWSALGSTPLNAAVAGMKISGLDLYAGGNFADAGGNTDADRIARFELLSAPLVTSFTALPQSPSLDIPITSFDVIYSGIVSGYLITDSSTPPLANDAGWSASVPISYPVGGAGSYTLYPWAKDAGGNISSLYGSPASVNVDTTPPIIYPNVWNPLGNGLSDHSYDTVISGTDLYTGGYFLNAGGYVNGDRIAKWNGVSWSPLGSGLNGQVLAIIVDGPYIYAGGQFTDAGGNPNADYVARWDGSTWSALGNGLNGYVTSIAVSGSSVYVGGNFTNAGGNANADYVAKLNGATWESLGTTPLTGTVYSIDVDGSNMYIAGNFFNGAGNPNIDCIARWDGTSWSAVGSGLNGIVHVIRHNNGALYAGGGFSNAGGDANADYIAKWDGSAWSALGNSLLNEVVYTMAFSGSNVYIGGRFTNAFGNPNADYIAKWDGTSWSALGDIPLNFTVEGMAIKGPYLYAGGAFTDASGNPNADKIAVLIIDTAAPTVASFTVPSSTQSFDIPITFTATDDITVTGYLITESSTPPSVGDAGWSISTPTTYTVAGDGSYTLYPWAKDELGNVSAVYDSPASVNVDNVAPAITAFTATSPSSSLNIPITAFTASDNIGVSGYKITESSTPPSAGDPGWTASTPTTYTVASSGNYTLYPWVKDEAGNVSVVYGSPATVAVDATKPTVNSFTVTSPSTSLNVPITAFTASDNIAVSAYLITESSTPPSSGAAGWSASKPTTFTVASQGSHTLYPWVKDAVGNVSVVFGSPSTVSVDTTAPTVTAFSVPASSSSLNIPINTFNVSDVVGVTGYLITESSTPPAAGAAGWSASKPTFFTVASQGTHTLYPWAKDAVGHVSSVYGLPASVEVDTTLPDTTPPSVDSFTAVSPSSSLNISITSFTASDNTAITGYLITESSTQPASSDSGWSASAPTTYTVASEGNYVLYPWAKDAAGNVSSVYGSPASVTVDTTAPTVLSSVRANTNPTKTASVDFTVTFSEPVTGVDVYNFSLLTGGGSDAYVTGVSGLGATYTVSVTTGSASATLRLDVIDDDPLTDLAGNALSGDFTGGESYTYDISAPTVDSFTATSRSSSLAISITAFTTSDNTGVTGYMITETSTAPAAGDAGWSVAAPITYTVAYSGSYTLYPWVKDAAGNVSAEFGSPASVDVDTPLIVTNTNDGGPGSLRSILASATSGDTVIFDSALSGQTIYLASTLILSQNVTIDGSSLISPITLSGDSDNDGTGDVRVIDVEDNALLNVTLNSLTITKGYSNEGGAILNGGYLTITKSTFSNNTSTGSGGAITNNRPLVITNSTFSNNSSTGSGGGGGAIMNNSSLTISGSTFSGNTGDISNSSGGAIYNTSSPTTITNSTFSGNSATVGGAILTTNDLTITNSTISGNSVTYSNFVSGLDIEGGTTHLSNTIIANSLSGIDCANNATIGTNTNNLIEDGSCSPALSGDPKLGPLADNGGPTQTFALLPGSSGINSGNDASCPATDQRKVSRPQGHHCDIGAYEYDALGGPDTVGVFRPSNGALYLRNFNTTGFANVAINYGMAGDYPVVGDWDGNGTDTIGVYRNGVFYLRNSNTVGIANITVAFGSPGDQPIAGDWNNDGFDTIGVYRSSTGTFLLRNSNTPGPADVIFALGNAGDVGIAGDWDGDGIDTTGVFRPSNGMIFLKNTNASGFANIALNYGLPGDQPVVGDWDNNGTTTIGIYRNARFYLRNSNTNGFANIILDLGNVGDMPIAGDWDGKP